MDGSTYVVIIVGAHTGLRLVCQLSKVNKLLLELFFPFLDTVFVLGGFPVYFVVLVAQRVALVLYGCSLIVCRPGDLPAFKQEVLPIQRSGRDP